MTHVPTAPDLEPRVADLIRGLRKTVDDGKLRGSLLNQKRSEEAGRYTTAGGALVVVHAKVHHVEKYVGLPTPGYEQRVTVGAVAECHGNGCIGPTFQQEDKTIRLLHEDADETADRVTAPVQAARQWAQSHAEKCRAQAYSDR
ncbi:hypothetical protein ABT119_06130 [Streptomyces sp. NPDC001910]|uniref:hypothetical protein n=1 Tax=Streptomyces sp. NPDC001910 TaxID=3154403 RepID=UPI00332C9BF8